MKEKVLQALSDAVVNMEEELTVSIAHQAIQQNIDAYEAIDQGLAHGMNRAGQLYEDEEYFIPELLLCSDAMYAGLEVLRPHLKIEADGPKYKAIIGVVEGDTHDIGKNLVKIMLETSGFEVVDLGRDVPPLKFVEAATDQGAQLICLSTLMTTTMEGMRQVIQFLKDRGIREQFQVLVGGGPISPAFAEKIGADGYAENATEAAKLAKVLVRGEVRC